MRKLLYRARFMRDHRWAPDQMSDYLDGELDPGRRSRFERHVSDCRECRRLLASLRATLDALHHLPTPRSGDAVQIAASVRLRLRDPPRS